LSLLAIGVLGAGCPWGSFDDLEDKAPVQVLERPDKLSSPQFGFTLLALDHPDHPRTLVVGGHYTDVLALVQLGDTGGIRSTRVARVSSEDLMDGGDREKNLVEAMTRISDSSSGQPRILVGVPQFVYLRTVTLTAEGDLQADSDRKVVTKPGEQLSNLGGALAAGQLDGADTWDWAVAEDDYTYFVLNESFDASDVLRCPIPMSSNALAATGRGLVAGRLFDSDPPGQIAFALGVPRNTEGEVLLYRFGGGAVDCSAGTLTPPVSEPGDKKRFGAALAVTDLNGDGVDDLAVGMPDGANSRVFLYLSSGGQLPAAPDYSLLTTEPGAVAFGQAVAFMDLDGDGRKELVVGDPEASFGDNQGRVHIFGANWAAGDPPLEEVVGDVAPKETFAGADLKKASTHLGTALVGLDWGNPAWPAQELVAGASELIYVFLRTDWPGDATEIGDPRFGDG